MNLDIHMTDNQYSASTSQCRLNCIMLLESQLPKSQSTYKESKFFILLLIYKGWFIWTFLQIWRETAQRLLATYSPLIALCCQDTITEAERRTRVAFVSFISKITSPENHSFTFMTADYISYWKPVTAITRKSIIKWMWFGFPQKLDIFHSKTDQIQPGTVFWSWVSSSQHFLSVQFVWNNSTWIFTTKLWSDSELYRIQKHIYAVYMSQD